MATGTVSEGLAVQVGMARRAFGHESIPTTLLGVISMEGGVTLLAVETVFRAIILEVLENSRMALAALGNGQRLRFCCIDLRCRRDGYRRDLFPFTGKGQRRQRQRSTVAAR